MPRAARNRFAGTGTRTIFLDQVRVKVTYRTIAAHSVANPPLGDGICGAADFSFVIDMSISVGPQGRRPSDLPDLKAGIADFVNTFQGLGGDGRYAGTRSGGTSASPITDRFVDAAAFSAAVDNLAGFGNGTPTRSSRPST